MQLPRGAIGWWPGDGNAEDLLAGHEGVLHNGAGFDAGVVDQAFSFDGVDDFVLILNDASLSFGLEDFAVGLWARTSFVGGTANDFILSKSSVGFDHQYSLLYGATPQLEQRVSFVMGDGVGTNVLARSPFGIADGEFHHLAGVRRGRFLDLYVDGQRVETVVTPSVFSASSANNVTIGGRENAVNDPYFSGLVDEVQIFRRPLTPCEIKAISAAGSAGQCKSDSDIDTLPDYADNCPEVANAGQEDSDADSAGDACDCATSDAGVFAAPGEVCELRVGDLGDKNALSWTSAGFDAGPGTVYDVLRGALDELPVGTGASETCVGSQLNVLGTSDPALPALGSGFWYVVRARNACGVGTYGFATSGQERTASACP